MRKAKEKTMFRTFEKVTYDITFYDTSEKHVLTMEVSEYEGICIEDIPAAYKELERVEKRRCNVRVEMTLREFLLGGRITVEKLVSMEEMEGDNEQ